MLNEALAKEVGRDARRREEIGSTAGELAVPQESKDMPIPPGSDPRKRRAMKAARTDTAKFDGRRVKHGRRGGTERRIQEFESTEH